MIVADFGLTVHLCHRPGSIMSDLCLHRWKRLHSVLSKVWTHLTFHSLTGSRSGPSPSMHRKKTHPDFLYPSLSSACFCYIYIKVSPLPSPHHQESNAAGWTLASIYWPQNRQSADWLEPKPGLLNNRSVLKRRTVWAVTLCSSYSSFCSLAWPCPGITRPLWTISSGLC